jgi:hypothetical protein
VNIENGQQYNAIPKGVNFGWYRLSYKRMS